MTERNVLLTAIVGFYAAAICVFVVDLGRCEQRTPGQCDSPRGRLDGALSAAPSALLALLVRSTPYPDGTPTGGDAPSTPTPPPPARSRTRAPSNDSTSP